MKSESQLADREQIAWVVFIGVELGKKLYSIGIARHRMGKSLKKLEPARWKPQWKSAIRGDWVVCQGVTQGEDIEIMVQMPMRKHDGVKQAEVDVPP
jgi:hypothetical protein